MIIRRGTAFLSSVNPAKKLLTLTLCPQSDFDARNSVHKEWKQPVGSVEIDEAPCPATGRQGG